MSTYKPPFARMRHIRRDAPVRPQKDMPENVEAALAEAAAKQSAGEEVADEIRVPVGAVDAVVTPGPDEKFGTPDDEFHIEAHKDDGLHEHEEPEVDDDLPLVAEPEVEVPKYGLDLKKAELVALADEHEVMLPEGATKAEIIAALDAHFGK